MTKKESTKTEDVSPKWALYVVYTDKNSKTLHFLQLVSSFFLSYAFLSATKLQ